MRFFSLFLIVFLFLSSTYWWLNGTTVPVDQAPINLVENKQKISINSGVIKSHEELFVPHSVEQQVPSYIEKPAKIKTSNSVGDKECLSNCLSDLKERLFNAGNDISEIKTILNDIASSKSKLAMQVLLESAIHANDLDDQNLLHEINSFLKTLASIDETTLLIESLLDNKYTYIGYNYLPVSTQNLIVDTINNVKHREHLVPVLAHVYLEGENLFDELFSGLDYPEMYSVVALEAEKMGNYELKNNALKKILTNPGKNTIQSLILFSGKNISLGGLDESFHLAKTWGRRYSSPKVMEFAESLIHSRSVDVNTKVVAIALLSNMEDNEKRNNILNKVRLHSEEEMVISYIDYSYQSTPYPEIDEILGNP